MVAIFQLQPDGSLKGPITWYLFTGWNGDPEDEDPNYIPVTFDDTGTPYVPLNPLAPTLSVVLTSRTTATVDWIPASGFLGPAILEWEVDVQTSIDDGANYGAWAPISGSPFDHDVFTASLTGLDTHTSPELKLNFRCRGINGDGVGSYSEYAVQYGGVVVNAPRPPRNLTVTNITPTSVLLSWTPSIGADTDGATKYGIWSGSTNLNIDIDPNAVSFVWSGLLQGHDYLNTNIRRFNSGGWSGGTNYVDFTTPRTRLTIDDPVMGQSVPDNQNAYRTTIPAIRVYDFTPTVVSQFNDWQPRVIAFTDDDQSPNGTSLAYVDSVEAMLIEFYEGSGSSARQNCELHVANGNEIDRSWTTGNLSQAFIDVYAALRDVIWQTTGGVRRFPKASVWVDMTANNIKSNGSGPRFKAIARYLDGMACSMYPAGRTIQASNALIEYDPASYPTGSIWPGLSRNAYKFYCDQVFIALDDWRQSGGNGWSLSTPNGGASLVGQLDSFATWEIGIPIHHSLPTGSITNLVRTGADATDLTQRPRYLVGGSRVTGQADQQYNMVGFLPYIQAKCDSLDVSMREQLYWNQWSNTYDDSDTTDTSIPNPWAADAGKTSPDSVTAWYNWTPGSRLADI